MADPGFFDGVILGAILLGGVFVSVYVGFFMVPALWILLLCGWPLIIVTLAGFELLRRTSRDEVMRGRESPFFIPPSTKYCQACGTVLNVNATACPACGLMLLPTYDVSTPTPKFCERCGSVLEFASRYRRGWCPRCKAYR
ncbi:MAG TPA: hypothetical protein VK723_00800 [Thermoplasmata archaeon]|nr:hypothetical protein [Thermoplasmata archaeon]